MRSKLLVLLLTGIVACSDSDSPAEVVEEPTCPGNPESFRFESGGDGHADPFGAKAAAQARAGKIRDESQIVQHPDAKHKVRVGDFVLANDRIAVYVEAEERRNGYAPFGGEILSIDVVGEDGRPRGLSLYNETLITFSRQVVKPERVSVIADGSDGGPAIVRVSGVLANIPFLDTFRSLFPDEYDFPAAVDYVLAPGSDKLTLRMGLVNTRVESVTFFGRQLLGFFQGSQSQGFVEGIGYASPKGEIPWLAWDAGPSAFLVRSLISPLSTEVEVSGFRLFATKNLELAACENKTFDYLEFVAGAPGIDGLLEAKRRAYGEPPWREVRGVVRTSDGSVVPEAYVHATAPDGKYLTRARTDATGAYVLHVPDGDVNLTPTVQGYAIPAATAVPAGTATADLTLAPHGTIDVTATDATTAEPIPVRIQVIPANPPAPAPDSFGLRGLPGGRLYQEYAMNGRAILPAPPGSYQVIVSRGYEYELLQTPVEVLAGQAATILAPLQHSVDSTGVMCADFHIHSFYSPDSSDPVESKVKGAVADGLDIPVSSEHEWVIDFEPVIHRLGVEKFAFGMPSEELTTFTWGHFGVIPLIPRPDLPNNGAVDWVGKKPAEIFAQVNALPEKPLLVVNHPMSSGFGGYFSAAGFEISTAKGSPDLWSEDFSAIEVFNDSDLEANRTKSVAAWFALLDAGHTKWATGSSDSHDQRTSPVGYPRTCMRFGHDDPRQLTPEIVRDVMRAGAAVVSGGLMMTVEAPGGIGPGGTATAGSYRVVVQAPGWLSADTLEVFIDGKSRETRPLTPVAGPGPGKSYEAIVDVQPIESRARHYVVFHAKGPGDLAPLHPGRKPFAVSNPVFF